MPEGMPWYEPFFRLPHYPPPATPHNLRHSWYLLSLLETSKVGGFMAQVKITVRPNGPFRVEAPEGSVELVDVNGTPYDLTGKTAFSLCRCGGSVNKPFCDGTHSRIGFQGAELAVKKAEGGS
jgi:CDGSH-type Zn-finger protein